MLTSNHLNFFLLCFFAFMSPKGWARRSRSLFAEERSLHKSNQLTGRQLDSVAALAEDLPEFKRILKLILVQRVVGTESHTKVRNSIIDELKSLDWVVDVDSFSSNTPIGNLRFANVIATPNPNAERFLDLACHYDSKYYPGTNNFVGATDSAVPCAMMLYIARALHSSLQRSKRSKVALRFIFFDGEEAFRRWSRTDSTYGARHLAQKWENQQFVDRKGDYSNQLDRMDMLVLLDLLGAKNPEFYSYFPDTQRYYNMFVRAENKLARRNLLSDYRKRYFLEKSTDAHIEDDHLPFLERDVPIVHLIAVPFPPEWHTPEDNKHIIDYPTTQNLMKIVIVFITEYLGLEP